MGLEKRYAYVLAVVALGSVAGAVHAEEAWRRTKAVAAFPNVSQQQSAGIASNPPASEIAEGTDLNRLFGSHRSPRGGATTRRELLPDPYASNDVPLPAPNTTRSFEARAGATYSDERWTNPYAVARNTSGESWANPYVGGAQNTRSDERWFNPYVAVKNTQTDERWSNPY